MMQAKGGVMGDRVRWSDDADDVIKGDITAAAASLTPAGGAVVTAVAPCGIGQRDTGVLGFTTSLGFGKKLERIRADPRVALAFHAREHGLSDSARYVLVHGRASVVDEPSRQERARLAELATPLLGARRRGLFWDRWLREYYDVRLHVHLELERIVTWPDLRCAGPPQVLGAPLAGNSPEPQSQPRNGTAPRIDAERAGKRVRGNAHVLLGFAGAD